MKNKFFYLMLVGVLSLISIHEVKAQIQQSVEPERILPGKGKSILGMYTSLLIGPVLEYSYGLNKRLSIGFSGGLTGGLYHFLFSTGGFFDVTPVLNCGIKVNVLLAQPTERMRIYLTAPLLYSFESYYVGPFVQITPTVNVEWKLKNRTRIWFGGGVQQIVNPGDDKSYNSRINGSNLGVGIQLPDKSYLTLQINPALSDISVSALTGINIGFTF